MTSKRGDGIPHTISISTMTFVKVVLIGLAVWFLWFIRDIIAILLVAILLAALIDPFADRMEEYRIPRAISVLILYVVLASVATLLFVWMVPVLVEQSGLLVANFSHYFQELEGSLSQFWTFSIEHGFSENVTSSLQSFQQGISSSFNSIFTTIQGVLGGLAALFLVLVLAFYMVVQEGDARRYFHHLAPVEYQPYLGQLLEKMQRKIGAWLRGQFILGLIVGVLTYLGLVLLGVESALLLAVIAGVMEVIPFIGPILAMIPAVIIGLAQSPIIGLMVVLVFLVVQQIENNLLVPQIMHKVTGLNPIVSIAALLVGVKVAGLVGAILSIPVATMAAVVLEDLFHDR